jgi:hypothetical protein
MGQPRFLIISRPARPGAPPAGTVWRLLGANNRHLGQSEDTFPDVSSCRGAIDRLLSSLDQGRVSIGALSQGQLWYWRIDLDGRPVARSARAYRRQRECQYNLELFLAGARSAAEQPYRSTGRG